MNVRGISWMGTRVDTPEAFAKTVSFFEQLGLNQAHADPGMVAFRLPNGDTVEVFGPEDDEHRHFATGPVVGFQVDDVHAGARELQERGVELLSDVDEAGGYAWVHFRGPDGNVYELSRPPD